MYLSRPEWFCLYWGTVSGWLKTSRAFCWLLWTCPLLFQYFTFLYFVKLQTASETHSDSLFSPQKEECINCVVASVHTIKCPVSFRAPLLHYSYVLYKIILEMLYIKKCNDFVYSWSHEKIAGIFWQPHWLRELAKYDCSVQSWLSH